MLARCSRHLLKLAVSVLLLAVLWSADWRSILATLADLDPWWLAGALALFIPQTMVSALRWQFWVGPLCPLRWSESVRQVLVSSAVNLLVPGKMGDLSKAAMLPLNQPRDRRHAAAAVAMEKATDVAVLAGMMLAAIVRVEMVIPALAVGCTLAGIWDHLRRAAAATSGRVWWGLGRWAALVAFTLILWCTHLLQIHWFLRAAGIAVPWVETVARVPAAIFAGLLPVSWCGVGTRDAALLYLFAGMAPAAAIAAVGLLTALRYLVPGAAGVAILLWSLPRVAPIPQPHFGAATTSAAGPRPALRSARLSGPRPPG